MTKKVYYLEYNDITNKRIEKIIDKYICFVNTKIVEMNYLEVEINCRTEDLKAIERELKDLIWARKLASKRHEASFL